MFCIYLIYIASYLKPEGNFVLYTILMVLCFDCNSLLRADVEFSTFVNLVLNKFWILVCPILVESTVV